VSKKEDSTKATNLTDEDRDFIESHNDLSDSTIRAKWIHSPEEHADHDGQMLATRSHEVIEHWTESTNRDGHPATVPGTEHGDRPSVLRIAFGQGEGGDLEEISWDDWFCSFDNRDLVFVYQDRKRDDSPSTFFRLDNPEREDG